MNPQDEDLEAVIIGACLIEKTAMPLIAEKIRPEMFYQVKHELIFAALLAMYRQGTDIDIITLKEEMARRGKLDEIGGPFYITQLSSRVASSAHLEYHCLILKQKYLRREMIVGFHKLLACAGDETTDIADTMVDAHNLLDRLEGEFGHYNHLRDMARLMEDTMEEARTRVANGKDGVTGIPTGLPELDKLTAGWQRGELIVGAARPAVGKTAFALLLAQTAARSGYHTAVYSLEMQGERLGDRFILSAGNMDATRWRGGQLSAEELAQAQGTADGLGQLPIYVDDSPDMSMDKIRSSARLLQSKGKCDMIIIDYLQLCNMSAKQTDRNREQEVAQAARKAKLLAKELNVPVILLSQLNRQSEHTPTQRPELSQLRESGAIEQDADVVFLLHRPALAGMQTDRLSGYPTEGLGIIIVAKNRNGQTGDVYFGHNPSLTRIGPYVPPLEWMQSHARAQR